MRTVVLDGKRWPMRDVHQLYKAQREEERRQRQLTLFELREDCRPPSQRSAVGRYREPSLFEDMSR